jgi:hypothetical protein
VIRNSYGSGEFLLIHQGVTQGDPLAMLGYALGMLPLTHQLKAEFPEVEQPWYADDAAAAAGFTRILAIFERIL